MTLEEVRRRVEEIKQLVQDDEKAHGFEDFLYIDVLKAIAKEALKTLNIKFSRWCA